MTLFIPTTQSLRYTAKPQHLIHKRENVKIALDFITEVENIKVENIGE